MTDDDPVPLKAGGEASPELVRALYALGKRGAADAARLERVAKRLEAALGDAPPPGAANGAKLLGTKTLITGIVIGVAALSWLGYQIARRSTADESRPTRAPESSQLVVPEPAPSPVVAASEPAVLPRVAAESPAVRERASLPTAASSRRSSGKHGGSSRGASASTSSASASAAPADAIASQAAPAPAAEVATEEAAAKPKPVERKLTTREEPQKPAAAPQRSEVGLLFEARKAMPDDPLAALRLLEEHAQRFPAGMLGPEREVLRIEALRKLGRTAEAAERMRAFETRYPNSIHLRRLQERSESSSKP